MKDFAIGIGALKYIKNNAYSNSKHCGTIFFFKPFIDGKASSGRHASVDGGSSQLTDLERDTLSPAPDFQGPTRVRSTRTLSGDINRRNYADPYSIPRSRLSRVYSKLDTEVADVTVAMRPRPHTVKIHGHTFKPTIAFDTFWYWCSERHAIYERRQAGQPFPWTDDKHLQKWNFCNTFRVLDKVSQYLVREVIEKGSQDPTELVFRIALFSFFTKPATWEVLVQELGPLEWSRYKREDYRRVLSKLKALPDQTLYTGAFQKSGPLWCKELFMNHLLLLESMMDKDLVGLIQGAEYMAEIFSFLRSLPGFAEFNAYQLLLNLSYSNVMNFSGMDFVVPCKGSESGLVKIFGREMMKVTKDPLLGEAAMKWLARHQTEHFRRLNLKPPKLGPKGRLMELADIEHALCEVDKYCRLAHPGIIGTNEKRKHLRRVYKLSNDRFSTVTVFPKAWSNPERQVVRLYPGGGFPVVLKQYAIQSLKQHRRRTEDGSVEFLVHWYNYNSSEDDTWEQEWSLLEDSPAAVEEYRKKLGSVVERVDDMRKTANSREFLVVWSAFDVKDATWEPEAQLKRDAPGAFTHAETATLLYALITFARVSNGSSIAANADRDNHPTHATLITRVRQAQKEHRRQLHPIDPSLNLLKLPLISSPPPSPTESHSSPPISPTEPRAHRIRQDLPPAKRARCLRYKNYVPEEETIRNDYSQHYVDSGEWPQNWVLGADPEHRFEEYPKQQRLLNLKKASVSCNALPPYYLPFSELSTLTPCKFDVIVLDPPFSSSFTWDHLQELPIPSLAADPSFVFIWVGSGAGEGLERGREVLAKWGYRRCEDVVWVKTNTTTNKGPGMDPPTTSLFTRTKQHCLIGIRGTVHTDVIIWEGDSDDPIRKPPEMYTLIENFCLGFRRLEIFGRAASSLRRGWVTVLGQVEEEKLRAMQGSGSAEDDAVFVEGPEGGNATKWNKTRWDGEIKQLAAAAGGKPVVPMTADIDALRPKSPFRHGQGSAGPGSTSNTGVTGGVGTGGTPSTLSGSHVGPRLNGANRPGFNGPGGPTMSNQRVTPQMLAMGMNGMVGMNAMNAGMGLGVGNGMGMEGMPGMSVMGGWSGMMPGMMGNATGNAMGGGMGHMNLGNMGGINQGGMGNINMGQNMGQGMGMGMVGSMPMAGGGFQHSGGNFVPMSMFDGDMNGSMGWGPGEQGQFGMNGEGIMNGGMPGTMNMNGSMMGQWGQ
ncbi:hypothetical protein D9758_006260 [Tetrapyrgos nigripes]|uniref:Chromo domain-containing protein n=1 Tax=Tetrapyrgos nigripes TaxID=182062 RepID=A0A8H5GAN5_9AGAR|nr:hypothetical protein D9758_006260 [Tetrapyrgos nigripes]